MILRYLAVFLIVFYYAGYVSYGNQPKDTLDIQQLMLQYQESLRKSKYDKALKDLNVLGDYLIYTELDHKESYHYFKSFKPYIHNCSQSEEKAKFYINYAEAATYAQDFEGSLEVLKEGIEMMIPESKEPRDSSSSKKIKVVKKKKIKKKKRKKAKPSMDI